MCVCACVCVAYGSEEELARSGKTARLRFRQARLLSLSLSRLLAEALSLHTLLAASRPPATAAGGVDVGKGGGVQLYRPEAQGWYVSGF